MAVTVLVGVAAACIAIDWWAVRRRHVGVEVAAKPAVMVALIALTLAADLDPPSLTPWIVVALACGLIGDIALLPTMDRFVVGLGAFLVGHVAYVGAFATIWSPSAWLVVGVGGLGVVLWYFARPLERALRDDPLRVPVLLYVGVIATMLLAGAGTGRWAIVAGSLAFATSDGLIGLDRFVQAAPGRRIWIMVLYHVGQAAIVAGAITG